MNNNYESSSHEVDDGKSIKLVAALAACSLVLAVPAAPREVKATNVNVYETSSLKHIPTTVVRFDAAGQQQRPSADTIKAAMNATSERLSRGTHGKVGLTAVKYGEYTLPSGALKVSPDKQCVAMGDIFNAALAYRRSHQVPSQDMMIAVSPYSLCNTVGDNRETLGAAVGWPNKDAVLSPKIFESGSTLLQPKDATLSQTGVIVHEIGHAYYDLSHHSAIGLPSTECPQSIVPPPVHSAGDLSQYVNAGHIIPAQWCQEGTKSKVNEYAGRSSLMGNRLGDSGILFNGDQLRRLSPDEYPIHEMASPETPQHIVISDIGVTGVWFALPESHALRRIDKMLDRLSITTTRKNADGLPQLDLTTSGLIKGALQYDIELPFEAGYWVDEANQKDGRIVLADSGLDVVVRARPHPDGVELIVTNMRDPDSLRVLSNSTAIAAQRMALARQDEG